VKLLEYLFNIFSVILDEEEYLRLARVRLLLTEQVLVLADNSSHGHLLVAKEGSAEYKASDDPVCETASAEKEPVEVMGGPELLEENSFLDDSLLLCSVEPASIDDCQLQPCSLRIAMRMGGFMPCIVRC